MYSSYWDIFMTIVLLLSSFLSPIDLSFPDLRDHYVVFDSIMYSIDLLFFV